MSRGQEWRPVKEPRRINRSKNRGHDTGHRAEVDRPSCRGKLRLSGHTGHITEADHPAREPSPCSCPMSRGQEWRQVKEPRRINRSKKRGHDTGHRAEVGTRPQIRGRTAGNRSEKDTGHGSEADYAGTGHSIGSDCPTTEPGGQNADRTQGRDGAAVQRTEGMIPAIAPR